MCMTSFLHNIMSMFINDMVRKQDISVREENLSREHEEQYIEYSIAWLVFTFTMF